MARGGPCKDELESKKVGPKSVAATVVVEKSGGSPVVSAAVETKEGFKTITMTEKFNCKAKDLYEILMDENRWKPSTDDQFDTIELSDEIVKLENFPHLNRLGTLLINNNRITRINPNIGEFLPKLHSLVLTNNRLVNLVEIDPLASIPKLQYLSLLDNNITKKPNYRLYVIHKLKSLRVLDFIKVKAKERAEAAALFSSKEAEEEVKVSQEEVRKVSETAQEAETPKVVAPTQEQILAIKAATINLPDDRRNCQT